MVPHERLLVSPLEELRADAGPAEQKEFFRAFDRSSKELKLNSISKADVTIDSVIFRSGGLIGSDEFGMLSRYSCERDAVIDEAQTLQPLIGDSDAIQRRLSVDDSTELQGALSPCAKERSNVNEHFQTLFQKASKEDFEKRVNELASSKRVRLVRWGQNAGGSALRKD